MFFLKKGKDGFLYLNAKGRQLINQFYKPPKQHGKKSLQQWLKLKNTRQGTQIQSLTKQDRLAKKHSDTQRIT